MIYIKKSTKQVEKKTNIYSCDQSYLICETRFCPRGGKQNRTEIFILYS